MLALNYLQEQFRQIYIVSHIDSLKDFFPHILEVQSGEAGSSVVWKGWEGVEGWRGWKVTGLLLSFWRKPSALRGNKSWRVAGVEGWRVANARSRRQMACGILEILFFQKIGFLFPHGYRVESWGYFESKMLYFCTKSGIWTISGFQDWKSTTSVPSGTWWWISRKNRQIWIIVPKFISWQERMGREKQRCWRCWHQGLFHLLIIRGGELGVITIKVAISK